MARISWHPAFLQAIQLELEDYLDVLTFESEHQLTTEPLKIDVLIIKKEKNVVIKKNIAQIFQACNVVEYKSPNDRATVETYHKTQCYSRLYAALNKVDIADMSVSVVATRRPGKLLSYLNNRYVVTNVQSGIYIVEGDTSPTQIVVSEELSEEDNFWLNSLRDDLTAARLDQPEMSKESTLPMDALIQVIVEANLDAWEELYMKKKSGVIFSEKLDAIFYERLAPVIAKRTAEEVAEGIAKGQAEGIAKGQAEGIAKGIAKGMVTGKAEGKAEGGRTTVLAVLRARFKRVPKGVEKAICAISDPIALESWAAQAATCQSLDEFAEMLK